MVFWLLLLSLALGFPAAAAAEEPLAEVDGVKIDAAEVDKALAAQLTRLYEQIYDLKRDKVQELVDAKLLEKEAAKRGLSTTALLDAEVTAKTGLVTEQEIDTFYQTHKDRLTGEKSKLRERIRAYLQNQKLQNRRETFLRTLRSAAKIVIHLKPPPVLRVDVKVDGAPFKGKADAPVTIVEFSDFHCPFCKRVLPTLKQIESRYGDKVRLVFRDFPIETLHPGARQGHEAARCAKEQGKFWPYHDKLFANAPKTSPEDLKGYAKEVGLDVSSFEKCFKSGKYRQAVQQDIEAGKKAGVTGTPAFFINGRLVTGAQPLNVFARVIDDELARSKKPNKHQAGKNSQAVTR